MSEFNELWTSLNVRMHRKQKKEFRNYISKISQQMNYECKIEENLIAKNIIVGDLSKAKYVFTAHYDTPPRLPKFFVKNMMLYSVIFASIIMGAMFISPILAHELTNSMEVLEAVSSLSMIAGFSIMGYSLLHMLGFAGNANKYNFNDNTSGCYALLKLMEKYQNLQKSERDQIAFIFFDNEEKSLLGSISHKIRNLKTYKDKTYINFDCIGLGKQMNLYYFGKKNEIVSEFEEQLNQNKLFIPKVKKSNMFSMSDHFSFRNANHVCLLSVDENNEKSIFSQIHSANDNNIDFTNIEGVVNTVSNLSFIKELSQKKYKDLKHIKNKSFNKKNDLEETLNQDIELKNENKNENNEINAFEL